MPKSVPICVSSTSCTILSRPSSAPAHPCHTAPHHTSTAARARSHTATRVNIINFSFTVAQCGRYSPSRCHPSCRHSPKQRPAVLHRWASPPPWNELAPRHVYGTCVWQQPQQQSGVMTVWYIPLRDGWESARDEQGRFRIPVCQSEGRSAVCWCQWHQRITRAILTLRRHAAVFLGISWRCSWECKIRAHFLSLREIHSLTLPLQLSNSLISIMHKSKFSFIYVCVFVIQLWSNWFSFFFLISCKHIGATALLIIYRLVMLL